MPKIIPDPTVEVVLPPNFNHEYFAEASQHPFRFKARRFQLVNAWWLAEAALLAYAENEFAIPQYSKVGLNVEGNQPFSRGGSTQCYVAHNQDVVIVAFRGTQVPKPVAGKLPGEIWRQVVKDLWTDGKFRLVVSGQGGSVHEGFKMALDEVWEPLKSYLDGLKEEKPTRTFWFTGHSLGAALATLAADRYGNVQGLYTFGSPLVGDEGFARDFYVGGYRFVNNNDVVARIPLWGPSAMNLMKWGRYEHVGLLKYIDEAGMLFDNPSMLERLQHGVGGQVQLLRQLMNQWANGDFGAIPIDCFNDHAPLYYALRIWNCYEQELQGV
ncbi:lipase family protein [Nitrospira sp. Ecomares 2.1]